MGYLVIAAFVALLLGGLAQMGRIVRRRQAHADRPPEPPRGAPPRAAARSVRFDRDIAWFAVPAASATAVAECMGLRTVRPSTWSDGLREVDDEGVFVTPPADGLVFVLGRDAFPRGAQLDPVLAVLGALARRFGVASWFATHGGFDYHGWAFANGGAIRRAFAYDGDAPAVVCDLGELTTAERDLGFFVDDPRDHSDDEFKWLPNAGDVLALAAAVGADLQRLQGDAPAGTGLVGRL